MAQDSPSSQTPIAEIAHGPTAFEQFLENNQKSLLAVLVLLVAGVLGFIIYRGVEHGKRLAASHALYAAAETTSLEKIIAEQTETPSASTARILLAQSQSEQGLKTESIQTLRDLIAKDPDHPAAPAAKASLAAKLMNQGESSEAASLFQQLVDDPNAAYLAPYAQLCLGDMAAAAGDKEKAREIYQRASTTYPSSGIASRITQRISGLDAAMPVEVDPPPPVKVDVKRPEDLPAIPTPLIQPDPASESETGSPNTTLEITPEPSGSTEETPKSE